MYIKILIFFKQLIFLAVFLPVFKLYRQKTNIHGSHLHSVAQQNVNNRKGRQMMFSTVHHRCEFSIRVIDQLKNFSLVKQLCFAYIVSIKVNKIENIFCFECHG